MANIKLLWHCGEAGWKTRGDYKAISPTASQGAATSQQPATFYERREGRRREGEKENEERKERKAGRSEERYGRIGGKKGYKEGERERRGRDEQSWKWWMWKRLEGGTKGIRASRWAISKPRKKGGDGGMQGGRVATAAQHPPPFTQPL